MHPDFERPHSFVKISLLPLHHSLFNSALAAALVLAPPISSHRPPPPSFPLFANMFSFLSQKLTRPDLYPGPIDVAPANMPELFDILLSDVDDNLLHNDISTALGSAYLSETPHLTSPRTTVDGILFGEHRRVLFPLVVKLLHKPPSYVVHFLYDSGSPFTFLSKEVCGVPKHFTCNH
jgi:hypothetical protein